MLCMISVLKMLCKISVLTMLCMISVLAMLCMISRKTGDTKYVSITQEIFIEVIMKKYLVLTLVLQ